MCNNKFDFDVTCAEKTRNKELIVLLSLPACVLH